MTLSTISDFGAYTVTNISPLDLLTPTWTFTGLYASNSSLVAGGLSAAAGNDLQVPGWDNVTNSYVVAGWSANVAWTNWNAVAAQLAGASLVNGAWSGPNWVATSSGGFFGVSEVGYGLAPDISSGLPAFYLFGAYPTGGGVPISTEWDLLVVNVPEPSAFGLGIVAAVVTSLVRGVRYHSRRRPTIAPAAQGL